MTTQVQNKEIRKDQQEGSREYQQGTTTSSTTYNTDPGVSCSALELEQIRIGYESILGLLNIYKARDIEDALSKGVTAEAILDAIEQTALAPRPTHYYLRAILRRYAEKGITTLRDCERDRFIRRNLQNYANEDRDAWFRKADYDPWA